MKKDIPFKQRTACAKWRGVGVIGIGYQAPHLLIYYARWVDTVMEDWRLDDSLPSRAPQPRALMPVFHNQPAFLRLNWMTVAKDNLLQHLVVLYVERKTKEVIELVARPVSGKSVLLPGKSRGDFEGELREKIFDPVTTEYFGDASHASERKIYVRCVYPRSWSIRICDRVGRKVGVYKFCTKGFVKKQFVRMVDGWILGFLTHLFPGLKRDDDKARAKPLKLPRPRPDKDDKSWYHELLTRVDKKSVSKFKSGWVVDSLCTNGDWVCLKWDATALEEKCVIPGMAAMKEWKYKSLAKVSSKTMQEWLGLARGACYVARGGDGVPKSSVVSFPDRSVDASTCKPKRIRVPRACPPGSSQCARARPPAGRTDTDPPNFPPRQEGQE